MITAQVDNCCAFTTLVVALQVSLTGPTRIRILNPEPDPETQLNPDPFRIRIRNTALNYKKYINIKKRYLPVPTYGTFFSFIHNVVNN